MAVFTVIDKDDLDLLIEKYEIGKIESFHGILEGVENTNYKIVTSEKKYILTIFEKRVDLKDLPFFIDLQKHLASKNIKCPTPISDKNGNIIQNIKNKKCVLMSFLHGDNQIKNLAKEHCFEVGKLIGKLHINTHDFKSTRKNYLEISELEKITSKCSKLKMKLYSELIEKIETELTFIKKNYPSDLPFGIIHGDAFIDNIFFIEENLSGIIDFYFSCNDFYIYDLSICINAWCFNKRGFFDNKKFNSLIEGYETQRKIQKDEKNNLNIILRLAALRILITRLHDLLFHEPKTYVTPKDPIEFYEILEFHKKNTKILV
tara:strand:- start:306 stop:1259 length:954 start_codon:yes stop_codon:yes gene_type:complete